MITISSCAKPECKTSSDCSSRACTLSKCENKKCIYSMQKNCCGNGINESIEDGKPGNQCTCPKDYGKCEGKGKVKVGSRMEEATYVHYYCTAGNECALGVEDKDISPLNFLDQINPGSFKASSVARYNRPFDVGKDSFEFAISLDDIGKNLVLPVRLTKVKILLSGEYARTELLIAEKDLDSALNGIGDKAVIKTPLTLSYKPRELEESASIRYVIDYTYTLQVISGKTPNGSSAYNNEIKRETFTAPAKPIFFVRSG